MGRSPTRAPPAHAHVNRYAHPFPFGSPAPGGAPGGATGLAEWNKQNLGPVPGPRAGTDGLFKLEDVIGGDAVAQISKLGELRFHALGDSGASGSLAKAEDVAEEMASDFKAGADALNPAFFFHLGDVVYGADKAAHYVERFYSVYRHYLGKIIAIPGNHDGEVRGAVDAPSLKDFLANFCAAVPAVSPLAASAGIFRETMNQPGPYWMLDAPFVRIVGLYSNLVENPGYLQGKTASGQPDLSQIAWLNKTLNAIKTAPQKKALIVATHHPPYSYGNHGGSVTMRDDLDAAFQAAGLWPDLFLSAHAHNYQHFTRRIGGREIPYLVAGGGGMPVQKLPAATGQPVEGTNDTTYDKALQSYGYLFVTVSASKLKTEFWPLGDEHTTPFETVTVNWS